MKEETFFFDSAEGQARLAEDGPIRYAADTGLRGVPKMRYDDGSLFTQRELEFIESEIYATEFEPRYGSQLVSYKMDVPWWSHTITAKTARRGGAAEIVGSKSSNIPSVSHDITELTVNNRLIAICHEYDIQELAAARELNMPLDTLGAMTCVEALETFKDRVVFEGFKADGLPGFFDDTGVTRVQAGTAITTAATADEMLDVLSSVVDSIAEDTDTVERPNTLALTPAARHLLARTEISAGASTSVLEWFLANNPYITSDSQVVAIPALVGAGPGSTDLIVATHRAPNRSHMAVTAPRPLGVQQNGLCYKVIWIATVSGVMHIRPKATRVEFYTA